MNENENFWYHNYQVVQAQLVEYYERNQKAIEYIEHKAKIKEYFMINGKEYTELLDILKGNDKNE